MRACKQGNPPGIDLNDISYYVGHETIIPREDIPGMWLWRESIFAFLQRNAAFFDVPARQFVGFRDRDRDLARCREQRRLVAVPVSVLAVLSILADMLDRNHVLILGGIEHDDTLRRTAGDADVLNRAADQLALVGNQHDLVGILDRE